MFQFDWKARSKSPFYVALLLILPVEGERDVFDRVLRLRRQSYWGALFAGGLFVGLLVVQLAGGIVSPEPQLSPRGAWVALGILGFAFFLYARYQKACMRRLKDENRYLAWDIYEIFWPVLVASSIGIAAPVVVLGFFFIGIFFRIEFVLPVVGSILVCIPLICVQLYFAEKIGLVYRRSLEVIGVK